MKELIAATKAATRAGMKLNDIIKLVHQVAVEESLIMARGNQTQAAEALHCNRQTIRKYTLTRQDKPMVGRWREHTGEQPTRRTKIEVVYDDGTSIVTYAHHIDWAVEHIVQWRPVYAD